MSSIFPERSLTRTSSQEVAVITGLTEPQKKQLRTITDGFLKDHSLIGYENTISVMPVIKQCIVDGLKISQNREVIISNDNLTLAFKKGYEDRNTLLNRVLTEVSGLNGEDNLQGELALPTQMVKAANRKINQKAFITDLTEVKVLDEVARARRPVFKALVEYCRDKVEQDIPGSKQVELTDKQQAGLVRHLVFSYLTFGEPRLILETEDFMSGKGDFLKDLSGDREELIKELAQTVGLESEESVKYLRDLATQIGDFLTRVLDKPLTVENTLEVALKLFRAFRALDKNFLVVNPFDKYPSLSENPQDTGRSIWDESRSSIVNINGITYRIPNPSTMELAAILLLSKNPDRAAKLQNGAKFTQSLFEAIERQNHDQIAPSLDKEITEGQNRMDQTRDIIASGNIPPEASMKTREVIRIARSEEKVMQNERVFINVIKGYHERLIKLGVDLTKRYLGGEPATGHFINDYLRAFVESPTVLRSHVRDYIRDRIQKRFLSLEDAYFYQDFSSAMISRNQNDFRKDRFQGVFDSTVLDVLEVRNRFWLNLYLQPVPQIKDEEKYAVWKAILDEEEYKINEEIHNRATRMAVSNDQVYVDKEKARILSIRNHPLTSRLEQIRLLRFTPLLAASPEGEKILNEHFKRWQKSGHSKIKTAISQMTDIKSLTAKLRIDLKGVKGTRIAKHLKKQEDEDTSAGTEAALGMVISTLARLAPRELWPTNTVNIESIIRYQDTESTSSGSSLEETHRKFREWLENQGISFDNDFRLNDLVGPKDVREMVQSAYWFHQLFDIEEEVKGWFSSQKSKLDIQTENYFGNYYRISPLEFVSPLENAVASKEIRLESIKRNYAQRLRERVDELKRLGLIMPA